MSVLTFQRGSAGLVNVNPANVYVTSNDNFATITATGYLNNFLGQLLPTDIVYMSYAGNLSQTFAVTINGINVTLDPSPQVLTPTVSGHFVNFNGTLGNLSDDGFFPTNPAFPLVVTAQGGATIGAVASFADTNGTIANANPSNAGTVGQLLYTNFNNPDTSGDYFSVDVTVTFAQLNAGAVTLVPSSGAKIYRIVQMIVNLGGTSFGGGASDVEITDGVAVQYGVITNTALINQNLNNYIWGTTSFPLSSTTGSALYSAPGSPIKLQYFNHTSNFTSGTFTLTAWVERGA